MMRRRLTVAALAAGLVLGVGACGGSEAEGGSDGDAPPEQTERSRPGGQGPALQGLAGCLREQGLDLPTPPGGGQPPFDPTDPDLRKALQACRDQLPEGAGPDGGFSPPGEGGSNQ